MIDERAEREARGLARLLRTVLDKVIVCAWCERVAIGGEWRDPVDDPRLVRVLVRRALVSHGICPRCFGRHAPGTAYPA